MELFTNVLLTLRSNNKKYILTCKYAKALCFYNTKTTKFKTSAVHFHTITKFTVFASQRLLETKKSIKIYHCMDTVSKFL